MALLFIKLLKELESIETAEVDVDVKLFLIIVLLSEFVNRYK